LLTYSVFSINSSKETEELNESKPFLHQVQFHGPQGEIIRVQANIDDGTMKEVMSATMFKKVKHRLGTHLPSSQLLRLANGVVIRSEAKWKGRIEVNGISAEVVFEVFDSSGKWDFLFRKSLLETFKAVHNYKSDEITVNGKEGKAILRNQSYPTRRLQTTLQATATAPICMVMEEAKEQGNEEPSEVDLGVFKNNTSLFTRKTDPFKVEEIL
jgi:hypothetical protein